MTIDDNKFQTLINDIPSIGVLLNVFSDEGTCTVEDREIPFGSFNLVTSFKCFESFTICHGDFYTPPSITSNFIDITDIEVNIYDNEGEPVKLSIQQKEILTKTIESSIITN